MEQSEGSTLSSGALDSLQLILYPLPDELSPRLRLSSSFLASGFSIARPSERDGDIPFTSKRTSDDIPKRTILILCLFFLTADREGISSDAD